MSEVPPTPRPLFEPRRIGPELRLAAAMRLVSQDAHDLETPARRLIASAPTFGIDLSLIWAVPDGAGGVRQACLAVVGSGRTSMLFLSEPPRAGEPGGAAAALCERTACVVAACRGLAEEFGERVQVAQALPDSRETWAIAAHRSAGLMCVGELTYLRRRAGSIDGPLLTLPPGMELTRFSKLDGAREALLQSLEASYIDTHDCPELCGLRDPSDILESHRATGKFDPDIWWVLRDAGKPVGCVLLNRCPEQRLVELVYIGLAPQARGKGLSRPLLTHAIREIARTNPDWPMTCAVDDRNDAAKRLYDSLGFQAFSHRTALVRRIDEFRVATRS